MRVGRLLRPVLAFTAFQLVAAVVWMPVAGPYTARSVAAIVLSPLWFLVVCTGLIAVIPLVLNRPERCIVPHWVPSS